MKITSGRNPLAVGVDYREEYPKVCYQSIQMKEAQPLPLDFTGQTGPVCLLSEGAVRAEALCCQGRDAGISGPSGYGEGDD